MTCLRPFLKSLSLAVSAGVSLGLAAGAVCAQAADAPATAGAPAAASPSFTLPDFKDIRVSVPRPVQGATSALGLGRARLALVVGVGKLGSRLAIDSAPRDALAVVAALRAGGFVVMLREDVGSGELRTALKEFRDRLQPGSIGFAYFTGLGAQVDGQNLLLPRDIALDGAPAGLPARLKAGGVPLQEVIDALMGTADSPRMLVVDAAYQHPALAALPKAGLAEQKLPPGMMALFGNALGNAQEVPAVAPLPEPPPADPRELAASRFTRVLVGSLTTPRIAGAEALRGTARAIADATLGQATPWVGGDTDAREDFAEVSVLDGLVPRTPEDFAREAGKQLLRRVGPGASRTGEQSVSEVLQQPAPRNAQPTQSGTPSGGDPAPRLPTEPVRPKVPEAPGVGNTTSALGTAASTAGTVVSAVSTVAGVAGSVAALAATAKVAEAGAALSAATTVAGAVGSGVGNVVSLASRLGSSSQAEQPARQVVQQLAAATPNPTAATPAAAKPAVADTARALAAAPPTPVAAPPAAAPPAAAPPLAAPPAAAPELPLDNNAPINVSPAAGAPAATALQAAAPAAARAAQPPAGPPAPEADAAVRVVLFEGSPTIFTAGNDLEDFMKNPPSGGESPVFSPRTNNFGSAEGDTFTYQVRDTWKDEILGSYTTAIEEVLGDGNLLANGHQMQMDPQGRLKSQRRPDGSVSQFEPAQELWWSNPKVGESRRVKFTENFRRPGGASGEIEFKGSSSVGRLRKIETPAGSFEAMPIETSGWYYETLKNGSLTSGQFSRTVWYSPKLKHPVAIDIEDADRLGKLLKRERVELLHAQQAHGAP